MLEAADASDTDWLRKVRTELADGTGSLVIRHVDRLSAWRLHALWTALEQALATARQQELWVAVTLTQSPPSGDLAGLLQFFPRTVELPPLRHHIEDVHELVQFFLAKVNNYGPLGCSSEAMQLLLRVQLAG